MIALVQMQLTKKIEDSYRAHRGFIENTNAGLFVFPECSLTGYDQKNLSRLKDPYLQDEVNNAIVLLDAVCQKKNKLALVGVPIVEDGNLYNCSILLGGYESSQPIYKKRSLTEVENGYFIAGVREFIFEFNGEKIGVLICRDQSNLDFFKSYVEHGASKIIIQSAHYYEPRMSLWKKDKNRSIPIARAVDYGVDVYKTNAVGMLNGYLSCGGSIAVEASGKVFGFLNEYEECVLFVE